MDVRHASLEFAVGRLWEKVAVLLVCHLASQCSGHAALWCSLAQVDTPLTFSCSAESSSYGRLRWVITNSSSNTDLVTSDPGIITTLCDSTHPTCSDIEFGRYEVKDTSTESRLQSTLTIGQVTQSDRGRWVVCRKWNMFTGQAYIVGACKICVSPTGGGRHIGGMALSKLYNPNCSNESPSAARERNTRSESNESKMFIVKRSASICQGLKTYFIKSGGEEQVHLKRTEIKGGDDVYFLCKTANTILKSTVRCNSTDDLTLEESSPNNSVSFKIHVNRTRPWYNCSCSVRSGAVDCDDVAWALFVLEAKTNKKERPVRPNPMTSVYYITVAILALVIISVMIGLCVFIYRHGSDLYSYYYQKFYPICPPLKLDEMSDAPARPPPRLPPRQSVSASVEERPINCNEATDESDSWTEDETPLTMPDQRIAITNDLESLGLLDGDGYMKPRPCLMKLKISPSQKPQQQRKEQLQEDYKEINLPAKPPPCGVERRASADAMAAKGGWCRGVSIGRQSKRTGRGSGNGAELEQVVSEAVSLYREGQTGQSIISNNEVKGHYEDQTPVKAVYNSNTCLKAVYDSVTGVKEPYKSNVYLELKHDDNDVFQKDDKDSITFLKQVAR